MTEEEIRQQAVIRLLCQHINENTVGQVHIMDYVSLEKNKDEENAAEN